MHWKLFFFVIEDNTFRDYEKKVTWRAQKRPLSVWGSTFGLNPKWKVRIIKKALHEVRQPFLCNWWLSQNRKRWAEHFGQSQVILPFFLGWLSPTSNTQHLTGYWFIKKTLNLQQPSKSISNPNLLFLFPLHRWSGFGQRSLTFYSLFDQSTQKKGWSTSQQCLLCFLTFVSWYWFTFQ